MQGPGPGPRYGHVMALVGQRYLMAIGGNDGKSSIFKFFHTFMNTTKGQFFKKYQII